MLSIRRSGDSVNPYFVHSVRGSRAFDELLTFQPVQRATHHRAFIADKPGNLAGAGKSGTVAVYESQYIPLTEQGNAYAQQATLDGEFQGLFGLGDQVTLDEIQKLYQS